jgi:hypothetical protein
MNREQEEKLLSFCASQHDSFRADAWLEFEHPDRAELAVTAGFLATSDWYGHQKELAQIADRLVPGSWEGLLDAIETSRFDCLRFTTMLRREMHDHAGITS